MNACANSLGDWIREASCWYRSVSLLSVMCLDLAKFRSGVDSKYILNGTPGQMARITLAITALSSYIPSPNLNQ